MAFKISDPLIAPGTWKIQTSIFLIFSRKTYPVPYQRNFSEHDINITDQNESIFPGAMSDATINQNTVDAGYLEFQGTL